MTRQRLRVSRYRFRSTLAAPFGPRTCPSCCWSGLVGGLSMGVAASGPTTSRRSRPSWPAPTRPTSAWVPPCTTRRWATPPGSNARAGRQDLASAARHAGPELRRDLQHPHQAERAPDGSGRQRQRERARQHRRAVLQSRPGDRRPGQDGGPQRADEIVATVGAARQLGLHVGQSVAWGSYSDAQTKASSPGTVRVARAAQPSHARRYRRAQQRRGPGRHRRTHAQTVILTPALTRRLVGCCSRLAFAYPRASTTGAAT